MLRVRRCICPVTGCSRKSARIYRFSTGIYVGDDVLRTAQGEEWKLALVGCGGIGRCCPKGWLVSHPGSERYRSLSVAASCPLLFRAAVADVFVGDRVHHFTAAGSQKRINEPDSIMNWGGQSATHNAVNCLRRNGPRPPPFKLVIVSPLSLCVDDLVACAGL